MLKKISLVFALLISTNAFTKITVKENKVNSEGIDMSHLRSHFSLDELCPFLDLTNEQRTALITLKAEKKKKMILANTGKDLARLEYKEIVANSESTIEQAEAASKAVQDAYKTIDDLKVKYIHKFLYEILTPSQKPMGAKCVGIIMSKKFMKKCAIAKIKNYRSSNYYHGIKHYKSNSNN